MAKTVNDSLQGINAYPIPQRTLDTIMAKRELSGETEATKSVLDGKAYNLARADVLIWLSRAPDISQGGQTYSFSDEDKKRFRLEADEIYGELEDGGLKTRYGYKGDRL